MQTQQNIAQINPPGSYMQNSGIQCPDYWVIDGSGNNAKCINVKDLGTCKSLGNKHQTMNFNTSAFTGSQGACNKYNWATKCNVTWDGITYGVNNPCSQ